LVNSASLAPLIGLPPKMAKFCHTFNRLEVGHLVPLLGPIAAVIQFLCKCLAGWSVGWLVGRSVSWSLVGWLVGRLFVGWSTIRVPGLWEVSLQKDKGSQALIVSLQKDNDIFGNVAYEQDIVIVGCLLLF
jgi:hypothetical protein